MISMNMIRPVSDLRNNFADISKAVHECGQPVFLTKNGYGDMVVLSMESYENLQFGKVPPFLACRTAESQVSWEEAERVTFGKERNCL